MRNTKTVLVTGANGFIGQETVKHLIDEGWIVFPVVRNNQKSDAIVLDFEDPNFLEKLKVLPKLDAIVHLAARVSFGDESLSDLFRPNLFATAALLTLAQTWGAFFVFSSAALVAGASSLHIDPSTSHAPNTPYMQTKWLAEQIISASGVSSAVLRIGGVFGLAGPGHLGLNRAIQSVINGERPTQVNDGGAKRNYIYVKDVARVIGRVLSQGIQGIHLVAGKDVLSISEMLQILCDQFIPGAHPEKIEGNQSSDQIIIPSSALGELRNFRESVTDIYADLHQ